MDFVSYALSLKTTYIASNSWSRNSFSSSVINQPLKPIVYAYVTNSADLMTHALLLFFFLILMANANRELKSMRTRPSLCFKFKFGLFYHILPHLTLHILSRRTHTYSVPCKTVFYGKTYRRKSISLSKTSFSSNQLYFTKLANISSIITFHLCIIFSHNMGFDIAANPFYLLILLLCFRRIAPYFLSHSLHLGKSAININWTPISRFYKAQYETFSFCNRGFYYGGWLYL